jgi:hypothetical protein
MTALDSAHHLATAFHSAAASHAAAAFHSAVAAADAQAKNPNGALGLLVFLVLAVAVVFLLRSMTKHLKKVDKINFDDQPGDATNVPGPPSPRA